MNTIEPFAGKREGKRIPPPPARIKNNCFNMSGSDGTVSPARVLSCCPFKRQHSAVSLPAGLQREEDVVCSARIYSCFPPNTAFPLQLRALAKR